MIPRQVQQLAVDGMAAYLAMQPLAKLRDLAAVYVSNSDAFAIVCPGNVRLLVLAYMLKALASLRETIRPP